MFQWVPEKRPESGAKPTGRASSKPIPLVQCPKKRWKKVWKTWTLESLCSTIYRRPNAWGI
jgi:hypothetical protein